MEVTLDPKSFRTSVLDLINQSLKGLGIIAEQSTTYTAEQKATVYNPSQLEKHGLKELRPLLITKADDGRYFFAATYSNNYRDQDWLPEIIALESHVRFEDKVDAGDYPLPELWIWHESAWKVGTCVAVATDVTKEGGAWALAFGYFDEGMEALAEALLELDVTLGMSHGMPIDSIARLQSDMSIIVQHQTIEVSILPREYAANRITEFVTFDSSEQKGKSMSINDAKRDELERVGIPPNLIEGAEKINAQRSKAAAVLFLEKKEVDAPPVDDELAELVEEIEVEIETEIALDEAAEMPVVEANPNTESVQPAIVDEPPASNDVLGTVAEAIAAVLTPALQAVNATLGQMNEAIQAISQRQDTLEGELKEVGAKQDETQFAIQPSKTLAALIEGHLKTGSAIGKNETKISKGSTLAKDKPEEAPDAVEGKGGGWQQYIHEEDGEEDNE